MTQDDKKTKSIDRTKLKEAVAVLVEWFPGWDARHAYKKAARFLGALGFQVEGWEGEGRRMLDDPREERLAKRLLKAIDIGRS